MNEKPVRLSDVATLAGVSVSTASKVLNGRGRVSAETRRRIEEVAERLDFRPNALARFFATGKSQTIGVVTSDAPSVFALPVLLGAQSALGKSEMATLLYSVRYDLRGLGDVVRRLRARQVDGVIVVGDSLESPLHSISHDVPVPVVYALGVSEDPRDISVTPDGRMVGNLAVQHLLDIGRPRVVHVAGPATDLATQDRVRGMLATLQGAGLELVGDVQYGDWSRGWGARAASRLLDQGTVFDAMFCGNDQIATGALLALRAAGVRVPDDVAIVGVDNLASLVRQPDGLITTVDTNMAALGEVAAGCLLDAGSSTIEPGVHYQRCSLVLGESTTGARPGAPTDEERYLPI
ncbi:LacI family transcriptional regulator [Microlunatus endophyticus]|uniref:LacI family transcriptional regulator n=1 Tax=Microlunatus endophyticus TaxID=1716077 RepID=A0A917W1C9_9ACTN|nr:LacI family DNA-binding transcriptional regulator [Microlunatus endophyticus]GGL55767.1 LacI family transcriptional regulator [Microlunatus endophyticus]